MEKIKFLKKFIYHQDNLIKYTYNTLLSIDLHNIKH